VCVHVHDQSGGNLIAQGRKRKQHELYVVAPPDNYAIINRKPAIFSMSCYFTTSARLSLVSSPIRRSYGACSSVSTAPARQGCVRRVASRAMASEGRRCR